MCGVAKKRKKRLNKNPSGLTSKNIQHFTTSQPPGLSLRLWHEPLRRSPQSIFTLLESVFKTHQGIILKYRLSSLSSKAWNDRASPRVNPDSQQWPTRSCITWSHWLHFVHCPPCWLHSTPITPCQSSSAFRLSCSLCPPCGKCCLKYRPSFLPCPPAHHPLNAQYPAHPT